MTDTRVHEKGWTHQKLVCLHICILYIAPTRQPQKFSPINFTFYCYLFT